MNRRGKGEGSIAQRPDGLWEARINIGTDATGKRLRKSVYGATKKAVADKLTKLAGQKIDGTLIDTGRMTVGDMLDRWLNDEAAAKCAANTTHRYRGLAEKHIKPRIGSIRLAMLKPVHVQGLLTAMVRDKVGARTQGYAYATCRRAFNIAVKWGLLTRNPCDAITAPRHQRKDIHPLTVEQAVATLKASEATSYHALFVLAMTTGLRQGELFGLQWADIDLDRGTLSVRHSLEEVAGQLVMKEPKSRSGRRQIALSALATDALWGHKRALLANGLAGGATVFPSVEGGWLRKSNFARRVWHPVRKAAGLPETITFHGLRHSAATLLLSEGISVKVIQEMLGHSNVALTLNTYSHVVPAMRGQAAATFDRLLGTKTA